MPNLYDLTDEARLLALVMAQEDLDDEQRAAVLARHRECTQEDLPKKLEARAIVIRNLKADAEQQKMQADYHARRAKAAKQRADWLANDTKGWMVAADITKYQAGVHTLSVAKCGGKQAMELHPDINADRLPDEFVMIIPEQRVPNKDAFRAALEADKPVPSVRPHETAIATTEPGAKLLPRATRLAIQ